MSRRGRIRLATRGSDLARRQAGEVAAALENRRFEVEVDEVETEGDRVRDELVQNLGTTGAFVRALDERVLAEEDDLAVHSMKDVPTEMPEDLVVAAVPEREAPGDVLVTPDGVGLADLPSGAVVGTGSLRRRAQVLAARPDLVVEPIRGNVDTRVEKVLAPTLQTEHEVRLAAEEDADGGPNTSGDGSDGDGDGTEDEPDDGREFDESAAEWFERLSEIERRALGREVETEYDGIVLAEAGLRRSGLARHLAFERLPTGRFVPAPGQGALAVTSRDTDVAGAVRGFLDHPRSRVETTAERIVLAGVGGGCIAPVGVHAVVQGGHVHVRAGVWSADGTESIVRTRDVPVEEYAAGAADLAEALVDRGARDLVEAAERATDPADEPRGNGP